MADKTEIVFVVNGQPTTVDGNPNQPLRALIARALEQTNNSGGQPLENWEVRDASGALLDASKKLKDLGLPAGAKLFLNLRAGVGG